MQINSPLNKHIKSFMVGLVASSAGIFVALPGVAMPEATETLETSTEAVEMAPAEALPVEALVEPTAEETLPPAQAEMAEDMVSEADEEDAEVTAEADEATDAIAETEVTEGDMVEETATGADALTEETIVETEAMEAAPVAEDAAIDEEPIADTEVTEEEAIAEDAVMDEEPVADVEAADDTLVEADEMTEEPVAEDAAMDEEPVAETEAMEEEAVVEADEAVEEPVAEEATETETAEDINTEEFTIAELTGSSDSFETLAAALEAADLSEVLGGEGPFTVFAPTDEAFAELPEGALEQLLLPENKDVLIQVLTYHVVPGAVLSTDLETGNVVTVEGSDIAVEVADSVTVNNANVVFADVAASNGVIHVIDRVILPPAPEADADIDSTEAIQ